MNKEEFIAMAVNELLQHKFSVYLHQKVKVEECGGWFDCEEKEFVVALDNPMGFEIFIHEYSHFRQYTDYYDWYMRQNGGVGLFFGWLDGVEYSNDILELAWRDTVALELDCEMSALELIKFHDRPVDVDKYKRAANAYLLFYHFVKAHRLWSKKSPYNNSIILDSMPTELQPLDYYLNPENVPHELIKHFADCFVE
jgi:hypothetical protein